MEALIKRLAEAWGPSGYEHHVRDLIRAEVEPLADELWIDPLGSLICRVGSGEKRIMTAAHMDEIGLIVGHLDRQGYARFSAIGSLFPAMLLGTRVRFENGVIGTLGVENPYSKRRSVYNLDDFFVDISASVDGNAEVHVGDPAGFVGEVVTRGERMIGKSLDDRTGCAIQIEAMRRLKESGTPHSVYFAFTVQEEVGSRGAQTAAYAIEPHLGIALDVTGAGDPPHGERVGVYLGNGVAIKARDAGLIVPAAIRDLFVQRAEDAGIPYQMEVIEGASTDGRVIQLARAGVPTGALSIPLRYVHTPSETLDLRDVQATLDLLVAILTGPVALGSEA
ncbi:MAG TPA: M20/M25/M40 family metallo-hydrolase [Aggregatilinea sp.]|uniref:M42 family metallopeptidase n=1 Tax=Aggregatilinea sp. TaxID=2806333 RepID=UPI002C3967DA|nr:M20/M25/M40 family metallo-hydrolase [Aggregatilinea sp.]HML24599.1 M20/M25/M40 family metallo-hydrolase [Aggregatilinea sp.]